ncbi:MAG: PTS transporter subunit EIIC [Erysipelothrix sp.]
MKKYSEQIQRFGRSLLLPIGVMAPVGLLLGISGAFSQKYMIELLPFLGNPVVSQIFVGIRTMSDVVFNNLPLLFAMGVAYGMSRKDKGIAVFSSVLAYLILMIVMNIWLVNTGNLIKEGNIAVGGQAMVLGIQTVNVNVFGGIIAGLIASWATDKFYDLQLPMAFAFFAGRKSVPLISMGVAIVFGLIIPFFWEYLIAFFASMSGLLLSPILGQILNGVINRLLIPFGLHHVWNAMLRFTEAGGVYVINGVEYIGYLDAMNEILFNLGPDSEYWAMMPELTRFGAQNQMVRALFVFPAIGLAMYQTAYTENKAMAKGLIITSVATAFFGNVTEPLEFTFLFIAPGLFLIYSVLGAVGGIALYFMNTAVGYIRGTIFDFIIFGVMFKNSNWINIVIVGVIEAVLIYFIFKWWIVKFNVPTPGREDTAGTDNILITERRFDEVAELVIEGLGGASNIGNVENCITRLRVDFKDKTKINNDLLKKSGCSGVFFPTSGHIHIVYGPMVEFVRNAVDDQLGR